MLVVNRDEFEGMKGLDEVYVFNRIYLIGDIQLVQELIGAIC